MTVVADLSGNTSGIDAIFSKAGYTLAKNITLAATTGTSPVMGVSTGQYNSSGGNFAWFVQFTGTSIKLQSLSPDGSSWSDIDTATATGTRSVFVGAGSTLRLYNPNGTSDTSVYSTLS